MKPTAVLVNTARGGLVDEDALARALGEGRIAAAALDTFAEEPLPLTSPLRAVDPARLILTPHNVSHSESGRRANLALALSQILALGQGEVPAHVVNPTRSRAGGAAGDRARRGRSRLLPQPMNVFVFDLLPYGEHLDHLKEDGELPV